MRQRADRDDGQLEHQRVPGGPGIGSARPGGQDGTHVGGAPPAERDRAAQRGPERVIAVGSAQGVQLGQLRPSRVFPAAAAPVMNASATGPNAQNAFSAAVLGRTARRGAGRGPP